MCRSEWTSSFVRHICAPNDRHLLICSMWDNTKEALQHFSGLYNDLSCEEVCFSMTQLPAIPTDTGALCGEGAASCLSQWLPFNWLKTLYVWIERHQHMHHHDEACFTLRVLSRFMAAAISSFLGRARLPLFLWGISTSRPCTTIWLAHTGRSKESNDTDIMSLPKEAKHLKRPDHSDSKPQVHSWWDSLQAAHVKWTASLSR